MGNEALPIIQIIGAIIGGSIGLWWGLTSHKDKEEEDDS